MFRIMLVASILALTTLSMPTTISADEHHQNHYHAHVNQLLVGGDNDDEMSIAEPVSYATVQTSYLVYPAQVVPVSDTIVTPYGYTPVNNNGYYQSYGYDPQYTSNPYYAGSAYGNGDPLTATLVNAVVNAAASGGRIDPRGVIQSLLGGLLAGQAQQVYQQNSQSYGQPAYYTQQPQVIQVYQQPQVIRVYQQPQYVPVQYAPFAMRHNRGEGDREHQGHDDHGGHD